MNDSSRGHFASKHPAGSTVAPAVEHLLQSRFKAGCIACAAAHDAAQALGVEAAVVGQAIDLLEGRIEKCQLGLFGYAPRKKIVSAGQPVAPDLRQAIQHVQQNGRLACAEAWSVAARLKLPRLAIGAACETLGLKIVRCQLGAF